MEKGNEKIEMIIDKLMSFDSLEQPALDFTDNVMSKVVAMSNSTATVYKPLITKQVWFVILSSFLVLVVYVYLKEPKVNKGWFNRLEWSSVSLNPLSGITFDFSATLMYAFVLLAIMVCIQVPLLKHYFNKRMAF